MSTVLHIDIDEYSDLDVEFMPWIDVSIKWQRMQNMLGIHAMTRNTVAKRQFLRDYDRTGRGWKAPYHHGGARAWVLADIAFDQRATCEGNRWL